MNSSNEKVTTPLTAQDNRKKLALYTIGKSVVMAGTLVWMFQRLV